jgi:hypothetical protein
MQGIALQERWKNPTLLMLLNLKVMASKTVEYNHFEDQLFPDLDQINLVAGYTADQTSWVVDDATKHKRGDRILVENTDEMVLCTAVNEDTETITVIREYGVSEGWSSTKAAILDNYYLRTCGNAFEEGHPFPDTRTTKVQKKTNYTQIFRTGVEMTENARNSAVRGPNDWDHQKMKKNIEHSHDIEKDFFKGKPYAGDKGAYNSSTGNTAPATTGGYDHWIVANNNSDLIVDQDDLTMFEYLEFLEAVFDKGSNEKFQYSPAAWFTALDKWGITKLQTMINEKMLGMSINRWVRSPGQQIVFIQHDFLKRSASTLYNYNYIIDHAHVGIVIGPSGGSRWRDEMGYKDLSGQTVAKQEMFADCGVHMELGDCHARLRFKTVSV